MFVKLVRINQNDKEMEIVVNTEEIAFITECEPHVDYEKPTDYEETKDENTGVITKVPSAWEEQRRFVIAFNNGRHPQFLDETNYNTLKEILLK